ncbi:MAG: DMT family transporter [Lewinellaceae bacterium]|nr:DMT family transporter [Saprospiraceae bacterium]MCB9344394.1 DMT family transporter [Lewinellaceae bacterium]
MLISKAISIKNAVKSDASYTRWVLLVVLSLIWGSSFILIKKGLTGFGYYEAATIRLMSAGLVFLPFAVRNVRKIPREKWGLIVVVSLLGMFIPAYLFCMAQLNVQSAVAAMLNSLTPIFTFLFSVFIFRLAYKINQIIGLILGLASATLLALEHAQGAVSLNMHAGLIVLATIGYGYNINLVKQYLAGIPAFVLSTVTVSLAGVLAFFTSFLPNIDGFIKPDFPWMPLAALVILGVMGTAIAQLLSYKLINMTSALFVSSITFIIPIVALLWGVLDGETFGWMHALGITGILGAVFLIRRDKE